MDLDRLLKACNSDADRESLLRQFNNIVRRNTSISNLDSNINILESKLAWAKNKRMLEYATLERKSKAFQQRVNQLESKLQNDKAKV